MGSDWLPVSQTSEASSPEPTGAQGWSQAVPSALASPGGFHTPEACFPVPETQAVLASGGSELKISPGGSSVVSQGSSRLNASDKPLESL